MTEGPARRPGAPGEPTVVYVLGAGHCGSTLLNLLLNGHSRMLGLSEIHSLGRRLREEPPPAPLDTSFWQAVGRRYEELSGRPFAALDVSHPPWRRIARWGDTEVASWAEPNRTLFASLAAVSGAAILVDSSKAWQRLWLLHRSGRFRLRVIHLTRDGRGVLHSYYRKYGRFWFALGKWAKIGLAAIYLRRRIDPWLRVRYEDLAGEPRRTVQEICDWLGVDFEPAMLAYRRHPYHGIGGNRMVERGDETIRLDERWRRELRPAHRRTFDLLCGWLNRRFGYR